MTIPRAPRPLPPRRPAFEDLLEARLPIAGDALDIGTGTGRVALAVAPYARRVVAVDIDASSLDAGRWAAGRAGLMNIEFVHVDAERDDLLAPHQGQPFELVTARLFLSLPLIERLARCLVPGGSLVLEALEGGHWKEAGGSRFNVAAEDVDSALRRAGFAIESILVEEYVEEFADAAAARERLKERRLWAKWRRDGRWDTLRAGIRRGNRTLTEAHVVAAARQKTP